MKNVSAADFSFFAAILFSEKKGKFKNWRMGSGRDANFSVQSVNNLRSNNQIKSIFTASKLLEHINCQVANLQEFTERLVSFYN